MDLVMLKKHWRIREEIDVDKHIIGRELTAIEDIQKEYTRAKALFACFKNGHEGIAVLREEYLKLEREVFVKNQDFEKMREEAVQVAAMAIRFIVDLEL